MTVPTPRSHESNRVELKPLAGARCFRPIQRAAGARGNWFAMVRRRRRAPHPLIEIDVEQVDRVPGVDGPTVASGVDCEPLTRAALFSAFRRGAWAIRQRLRSASIRPEPFVETRVQQVHRVAIPNFACARGACMRDAQMDGVHARRTDGRERACETHRWTAGGTCEARERRRGRQIHSRTGVRNCGDGSSPVGAYRRERHTAGTALPRSL